MSVNKDSSTPPTSHPNNNNNQQNIKNNKVYSCYECVGILVDIKSSNDKAPQLPFCYG